MEPQARIIADDDERTVTAAQAGQVVAAVKSYLVRAGASQAELARRSGVSASTLSMFLSGMYAGDWRSVALDLDAYLCRIATGQRQDRLAGFVETRVYREIQAAARIAMERPGIGLIIGGSGVGKTAALKRIKASTPLCVMISASTAKRTVKGLLMDIGEAVHRWVGERSTAETFNRTADALRVCKLLIVDEIHKYVGREDCFEVLRDLYDATDVPQLWSGTTDLIRYFDRKIGQGREPLAQIRRRIVVARDLNDLATEGGMFSSGEIRKLLAAGRYKLDPSAVRYMVQLANLPGEGALGLVKNLYAMAAKLAEAQNLSVITADTLRAARGFQVSRRTSRLVESKLKSESADELQDQQRELQRATA